MSQVSAFIDMEHIEARPTALSRGPLILHRFLFFIRLCCTSRRWRLDSDGPDILCCVTTSQEMMKAFTEIGRLTSAGVNPNEKLVCEVDFWLNFILQRLENYLRCDVASFRFNGLQSAKALHANKLYDCPSLLCSVAAWTGKTGRRTTWSSATSFLTTTRRCCTARSPAFCIVD
jgi:hypothetical protein